MDKSTKNNLEKLPIDATLKVNWGGIIVSGLVISLLSLVMTTSVASLLFNGPLSAFYTMGIKLAFMSTAIISLVILLTSSFDGMIGITSARNATIMGVAISAMVLAMGENNTPSAIISTAVAAIALTTLVCGSCFYIVGKLKIGGVFRFIPYPVVAGFLAGVGFLILLGGINIMSDKSISVYNVFLLFEERSLKTVLPGLVFGLIVKLCLHKVDHFLTLPTLIVMAIIIFFVLLRLYDIDISSAREMGLLTTVNQSETETSFSLLSFNAIEWSYIPLILGGLITILLMTLMDIPLSVSAMEVLTNQDLDINKEFKSSGLANIVSGLFLGFSGLMMLSLTSLSYKLSSTHKLVGLIVTLVSCTILFVGLDVITLIPKFVLGGLLFFIGLNFLEDFIVRTWSTMGKLSYTMLLVIFATIIGIGFIQGVVVGIILTSAYFVFSYSRVNVVRKQMTGKNFNSNVDRIGDDHAILNRRGGEILILQLKGFIFFGTANKLYRQIKETITESQDPAVRYLLLDFKAVEKVDSSSVNNLARLRQFLEKKEISLVLSDMSEEVKKQLTLNGFFFKQYHKVHEMRDLDHAMEWCENQVIQSETSRECSIEEDENNWSGELIKLIPKLENWMTLIEINGGQKLISKGDPPDAMYLTKKGRYSVKLVNAEGKEIRLRSLGEYNVVGELGFYIGYPASADVYADTDGQVYKFDTPSMIRLEMENPQLANELHKTIIKFMGQKIVDTNSSLMKAL